jgi:hypothetical protein
MVADGTAATAATRDGVTVEVALTVLLGTLAVAATREGWTLVDRPGDATAAVPLTLDGVTVVGALAAKDATRYERSMLVFVCDMVTDPAETPFL